MNTKLLKLIAGAGVVALVGLGCNSNQNPAPSPDQNKQPQDQQPGAATSTQQPPVAQPGSEQSNVWTHPTYKFSFELPKGTIAVMNKDGVTFVDEKTKIEYANLIVMQDIPRVPLPDNMIDSVTLDGAPAKVYHDRDAQTGTQKIDKLIADMPNSVLDVYLAVNQKNDSHIKLSNVIKTWKWNK